jgi:hypothetical protein
MRLTRSASGYNIRLKGAQHGIPPILLRESSLRPSLGQLTRRYPVGTRAQCFVFQLFADRIGIDRYRITPPRQAQKPLKHLKHETSTKHQCVATIRLEVKGPGAGSHRFGFRPQCSASEGASGASPNARIGGTDNRVGVRFTSPMLRDLIAKMIGGLLAGRLLTPAVMLIRSAARNATR